MSNGNLSGLSMDHSDKPVFHKKRDYQHVQLYLVYVGSLTSFFCAWDNLSR
jgi:hypothetical protein